MHSPCLEMIIHGSAEKGTRWANKCFPGCCRYRSRILFCLIWILSPCFPFFLFYIPASSLSQRKRGADLQLLRMSQTNVWAQHLLVWHYMNEWCMPKLEMFSPFFVCTFRNQHLSYEVPWSWLVYLPWACSSTILSQKFSQDVKKMEQSTRCAHITLFCSNNLAKRRE